MTTLIQQVDMTKAIQVAQSKIAAKPIELAIDTGQPFSERVFDLFASFPTLTSVVNVPIGGHQLLFRRDGSASGARLNLNIGGQFADFYPGARIVGPFKGFQVQRSKLGCLTGVARLVVVKQGYDFLEPAEIGNNALSPKFNVSATGVAMDGILFQNKVTPTISDTATLWWKIAGWRRVRVTIDTVVLGDVTITPYFIFSGDADVNFTARPDLSRQQSFAAPPDAATASLITYFDLPNTFAHFIDGQTTVEDDTLMSVRVDASGTAAAGNVFVTVEGIE